MSWLLTVGEAATIKTFIDSRWYLSTSKLLITQNPTVHFMDSMVLLESPNRLKISHLISILSYGFAHLPIAPGKLGPRMIWLVPILFLCCDLDCSLLLWVGLVGKPKRHFQKTGKRSSKNFQVASNSKDSAYLIHLSYKWSLWIKTNEYFVGSSLGPCVLASMWCVQLI